MRLLDTGLLFTILLSKHHYCGKYAFEKLFDRKKSFKKLRISNPGDSSQCQRVILRHGWAKTFENTILRIFGKPIGGFD